MNRQKQKTIKSKVSFTLLEVMACLFLIALLAGVIGIEGSFFVSYHRFRMGAQTFLVDVQKWQTLAMSLNTDITCSIETKKGKSTVSWKTDSPMAFEGTKLHYVLPKVESVFVKGKASSFFSFTIFSSGKVSVEEILTLKDLKGKRALSIDLTYPNTLIEGEFTPAMETALERSTTPTF